MTSYKNELIVCGSFKNAGGTPANGIASWDGRQWKPLGAGLEGGTAGAMLVQGEQLLVGGSFTSAGGQPALRLAQWDGRSWSAYPVAPPASIGPMVEHNGAATFR
jgi:hypothetical protein